MTQMPPPGPGASSYQTPQPGSGLAIASLILGILSLVTFCLIFVSAPLAVIAIILGIVASNQVKAGRASGGGMARAGMVLGIIALCLTIAIYILARMGAVHFMNWAQQKQQELQQQQQQMQRRTTTSPSELFHFYRGMLFTVSRAWMGR
jgi:Na+/H+-dicarboxylate symporter